MEDISIKKLELNVHTLNRRFDDHDQLHAKDAIWKEKAEQALNKDREDIATLREILLEIQKQTAIFAKQSEDFSVVREYAKKTYEVFQPLTVFSGYVVKVGIAGLFIWHSVKLLIAKAAAFHFWGTL